MSVLTCPSPGNINPLMLTGYQFGIQKLPELTYFVQKTEIPQITLGTANQASPFANIKIPGDTMEFPNITMSFIVDEELANWNAIFFWMTGLGFPENNEMYGNFLDASFNTNSFTELAKGYSDGTLTILSNTNAPKQVFTFVDMYPVALSGLNFDSTKTDVSPAIAEVTFAYTYFKINKKLV